MFDLVTFLLLTLVYRISQWATKVLSQKRRKRHREMVESIDLQEMGPRALTRGRGAGAAARRRRGAGGRVLHVLTSPLRAARTHLAASPLRHSLDGADGARASVPLTAATRLSTSTFTPPWPRRASSGTAYEPLLGADDSPPPSADVTARGDESDEDSVDGGPPSVLSSLRAEVPMPSAPSTPPPPPPRDDGGDDDGMHEVEINIEFDNLGLRLRESGLWLLRGVTGKLTSGRVCAIMGPSGAGKTTLMNTLSNKAHYGDRTGVIRINGVERPLSDFKDMMGFVPQDDVMHRDLTVEENLWHSAGFRLPAALSSHERLVIIERACCGCCGCGCVYVWETVSTRG